MPIIKSAKKKLRQDAKKLKQNTRYKIAYEKAIKSVKQAKQSKKDAKELLKKAYSQIDKAVKVGIFHKNKAARLKSNIAKFVKG